MPEVCHIADITAVLQQLLAVLQEARLLQLHLLLLLRCCCSCWLSMELLQLYLLLLLLLAICWHHQLLIKFHSAWLQHYLLPAALLACYFCLK
jgi:hypothetical protein